MITLVFHDQSTTDGSVRTTADCRRTALKLGVDGSHLLGAFVTAYQAVLVVDHALAPRQQIALAL